MIFAVDFSDKRVRAQLGVQRVHGSVWRKFHIDFAIQGPIGRAQHIEGGHQVRQIGRQKVLKAGADLHLICVAQPAACHRQVGAASPGTGQ